MVYAARQARQKIVQIRFKPDNLYWMTQEIIEKQLTHTY